MNRKLGQDFVAGFSLGAITINIVWIIIVNLYRAFNGGVL